MSGSGTEMYPHGDIYEGNYLAGMRHGQGKMTYSDGDIEEGMWDKDNFDES